MSNPRPTLDSVTTINNDGSRHFLHPADTHGRWTLWRRWVAGLLIAVYVLLPWVPVGGFPAVFLDVAERRFHFFGWTVASQDAWLLFFLFSGVGFSLFLVTALLGRVWCGWGCPQTVFLEHVFRRIERWIEGDAVARHQLDAAPWEAVKVRKRIAKHAAFGLVAVAITHVLISYFVSLPRLYSMITHMPTAHWGAFVFMVVASGVLYFNFAWFREQLCIVLCPYGRIQSALIDDHSLVIGYDARRGEPRKGRAGLAAATAGGDCIDCLRCVQVCPTGIDIRQGLQMECIGCTACIDACDAVMTRVKRPRGLIRYDSLAAFAGGRTRWFRPRTVFYAVLLAIGATVALNVLTRVRSVSFSPMRMPGGAYFFDGDTVRNQFLVRLTNKTNQTRHFSLSVSGAPSALQATGLEDPVAVAPMAEVVHTVIVRLPRGAYTGRFRFQLQALDAGGGPPLARAVEFLGPDPLLLKDEYWREKSAH